MSGHSKWSTIKRAKAAVDAKRGAIFTKLANAITLAARQGGDPQMNPNLKVATDKARSANMPKDNIERAIKKGTGELAGEQIEEIYYEGIGPANVQFVIKCLTNNKNRSASTVRHAFTKVSGSLGTVMWNFRQLGVVRISNEELTAKKISEEELALELIDHNIIDFEKEVEGMTIYSNSRDLHKIKEFLEEKGFQIESAEMEYVANEKVSLNEKDAEKITRFIEELENNEDISDYYTNLK